MQAEIVVALISTAFCAYGLVCFKTGWRHWIADPRLQMLALGVAFMTAGLCGLHKSNTDSISGLLYEINGYLLLPFGGYMVKVVHSAFERDQH